MSSHSKVPANYARPRVTLVHSPATRSASTRDLATYIGAHLVLGGYAECDVAPWKDEAASIESMSVKDLRAFAEARGVRVPSGIDKCELVSLARDAPTPAVRVVRHNGKLNAAPVSVAARDLRVSTIAKAAMTAITKTTMILLVVDAEDAKAVGKFVAEALSKRESATTEVVPVVLLSPDVMAYAGIDLNFNDDARPLPKNNMPDPTAGDSDEAKKQEEEAAAQAAASSTSEGPRELGGKPILVDGALGFEVGLTRDGVLAATTRGGMTLERLDTERDALLSKFYDLVCTSEIPVEYRARSSLPVATWGSLLLNGPLLAVAAVSKAEDRTLVALLRGSREARLVVAAAMREAREALEASAENVRNRAIAQRDARDGDSLGGALQASRRKNSDRWAPNITASLRNSLCIGCSYRALEWVLCLPSWLFVPLGATFIFGIAPGVLPSASADVDGGRQTRVAAQIDELIKACDRTSTKPKALLALQAALRDARVKGDLTYPRDLYVSSGSPTASQRDARHFAGKVGFFLFAIFFLCCLVELMIPSRGKQTLEILSGPDEL